MTATMDIWIRTFLAATAVVVLAFAPGLVRTAEPDDATASASQLEQPSPDERSSRPRPSRGARRDTQRPVDLSAPVDLEVLVPPLRPTTEAEGEVALDRDGGDREVSEDLAAPAGTGDGPPGTSIGGDHGGEAREPERGDDGHDRRGGPDGDRAPAGEHVLGELDVEVAPLAPEHGGFTAPGTRQPSGGGQGGGLPGPGNIKGGPGCSIQCITSGVAYARGVNAKLVVKTDTPALITLSVHGAAPNSYHVSSGFNQLTDTFSVDLTGLQPGTTYQVLATAEDAEGHTSYATGSFTTLRREAEVTFHLNWQVTATPYDARFHYHYRVDHTWRAGLTLGYWPYPQPPADLPKPVTVTDAPRHLDVAAQVVVEDEPNKGLFQGGCPVEANSPEPFGPFDVGTGGLWGYDLNPGPDGCHPVAWSTAKRCTDGIDLDARPADATSWTEHVLSVSVTTTNGCSNQPLSFTVPATVAVSYVP